MEKLSLQSVIGKYYLDGLIEKARWNIKDKVLTIPIVSVNKNLVGEVQFPFESDDTQFAVFDTSRLLKLLNITDKFIVIDFDKNKAIARKMKISDSNYNLDYTLQDVMIAPTLPKIEEPSFDIKFEINDELVTKFNKAKKALDTADTKTKIIANISASNSSSKEILVVLGLPNDHSDKIEFTHPAEFADDAFLMVEPVNFPAEELRLIFNNNSTGTGELSGEGLMKLTFDETLGEQNCKSKYYLIAN